MIHLRAKSIAVVIVAFLLTGLMLANNGGTTVEAQNFGLRVVILQGQVTIGGQQAGTGHSVTAVIRDVAGEILFESTSVPVGKVAPGRYSALTIGPAEDAEFGTVEFWLDGVVKADETTIFARYIDGVVCYSNSGCGWALPDIRTLNLSFGLIPTPTATATATPTPTPKPVSPSLFSGSVFAGSGQPKDGTTIELHVGDYVSYGTVNGGRYQILAAVPSVEYVGMPGLFFIGGVRSFTEVTIEEGVVNTELPLLFAELPAEVVPTSTPQPTLTPEPVRTATPVPTPTPTVTPTVTPTAIVMNVTLSDEEIYGESESGCGSNAGGPAGLGTLGVFAIPFALRFRRKLRLG